MKSKKADRLKLHEILFTQFQTHLDTLFRRKITFYEKKKIYETLFCEIQCFYSLTMPASVTSSFPFTFLVSMLRYPVRSHWSPIEFFPPFFCSSSPLFALTRHPITSYNLEPHSFHPFLISLNTFFFQSLISPIYNSLSYSSASAQEENSLVFMLSLFWQVFFPVLLSNYWRSITLCWKDETCECVSNFVKRCSCFRILQAFFSTSV